jgi:hypothetical protein
MVVWFHNRLNILVMGGILAKSIKEFLSMTGHRMSMLSEDYNDNIVKGIYLNLNWLLQVWWSEYRCQEEMTFQILK